VSDRRLERVAGPPRSVGGWLMLPTERRNHVAQTALDGWRGCAGGDRHWWRVIRVGVRWRRPHNRGDREVRAWEVRRPRQARRLRWRRVLLQQRVLEHGPHAQGWLEPRLLRFRDGARPSLFPHRAPATRHNTERVPKTHQ